MSRREGEASEGSKGILRGAARVLKAHVRDRSALTRLRAAWKLRYARRSSEERWSSPLMRAGSGPGVGGIVVGSLAAVLSAPMRCRIERSGIRA